jgi:hypothetical protein
MRIQAATLIRASAFGFLFAAALAGMSCTEGSPTGPSTTLPGSTGGVDITIEPNPVPFSGSPITDTPVCANYENTWFYDTVLRETAGVEVMLTSRVDLFDDKTANTLTGLSIVLPPHGTQRLRTRWCSGADTAHTAQSSFSGADAQGRPVTVTSPVARLMKR